MKWSLREKQRDIWDRHHREGDGKREAEIGVMCPQAKQHHRTLGAIVTGAGFPLRTFWGGWGAADTSISDF